MLVHLNLQTTLPSQSSTCCAAVAFWELLLLSTAFRYHIYIISNVANNGFQFIYSNHNIIKECCYCAVDIIIRNLLIISSLRLGLLNLDSNYITNTLYNIIIIIKVLFLIKINFIKGDFYENLLYASLWLFKLHMV